MFNSNPSGGPPGTKIPGKYIPGITESNPHSSGSHPEWHIDIDFNQGRLPGQLPLPYPKIHVPVKGPGSGPRGPG